MTPCAEHSDVRLIEMDDRYVAECQRCMSMVPIPTGICWRCGKFLDDHTFYYAQSALSLPICPSR